MTYYSTTQFSCLSTAKVARQDNKILQAIRLEVRHLTMVHVGYLIRVISDSVILSKVINNLIS